MAMGPGPMTIKQPWTPMEASCTHLILQLALSALCFSFSCAHTYNGPDWLDTLCDYRVWSPTELPWYSQSDCCLSVFLCICCSVCAGCPPEPRQPGGLPLQHHAHL